VRKTDRRIRRTRKVFHDALISLVLEKDYESITVQEILDRADIGRSTFYLHFDGKDELLISMKDLRETLNAAMQRRRASLTGGGQIIGFGEAMFQHANEYRNVYYAVSRPVT
jgi:AcrR family transcriptional regulator